MLVSFLTREILLAMMFTFVETRPVLMPTGLLIIRAYCKRPMWCPTAEYLHPLIAHDSAAVLSANSKTDGCGSRQFLFVRKR